MRIKQKYESMGIRNRAIFTISILLVLIMLLFTYLLSSMCIDRMSEDNISLSHNVIDNTINHLDVYIDEIVSIANEANYNYYLQNYLSQEIEEKIGNISLFNTKDMKDYKLSTQVFSNVLNDRTDVSTIMIFGEESLLLYKTIYSYTYVITDHTEYNWYKKAVESKSEAIVTGPQKHEFLEGNTDQTISISRTITNSNNGEFMGVILVDVNLNRIAEICGSSYKKQEGRICLLSAEGELIYEQYAMDESFVSLKDAQVTEQLKEGMSKTKEADHGTSFFVDLGKETYQVVYESMEKTGWKVLSLTPYSVFEESATTTIVQILIAFLLQLLVIIFTLNLILGRIIRPITALKENMDAADMGNLRIRAEVHSKDEVGMLSKSFNQMLDRIENLKEQVTTEQELKRKFEFQVLQAQINPHFLYNTLDSIIWMAEMKDPNVVPMTEALAKLFRISLNKGNEYISITQELEHVRNYLLIQSIRYANKFEYEIIVQEKLRYLKTIKLIVQPIVENSIYHGIKKKRGNGKIIIRAYKEIDTVIITVSDNGIGMEEELCRQILEYDLKTDNTYGSGIGVKNVNERIGLYFGKTYGLQYKSILGEGTTVTIRLPVLEEVLS